MADDAPIVPPVPVVPTVSVGGDSDFTERLKSRARDAGFVLAGVTLAATPGRLDALHRWLDAGYAGQMHYLPERRDAYAHPRHVLDGCRTIAMLALPYDDGLDRSINTGGVARYARGADYHDVIHERLKELRRWILGAYPAALVRGVVDTAPLLERELAEAAGLGWIGKNTLLLNRRWGSYFFLAALLTNLDLRPDPPMEHGYCGTCTACLDACPTGAFPTPYVLDATRCISYLTIEHRDAIAEPLRSQLSGWVFGCDVCQEVCPWNRKAERSTEPPFAPRDDLARIDPRALLRLSEEEFRERFRHTPLWRSKRRGIVRNAILVVASKRMLSARAELSALLDDADPLIRDAASWALAQWTSD